MTLLGGCCYNFREEFQLRKFGLGQEHPSLFVIPQCFSATLYIAWTVFWALFYTTNLALEVYYYSTLGAKYFIYVTNISYLIQSALVFTDLVVTVYVNVKRKDIRDGESTGLTWYIRLLWVLFNTANTFSVLVSIIYYALLDVEFTYSSIYTHLISSVYTILGLLFSAKHVQLLHFYQPMIPALVYLVFSIIYHVSGGERIYSILDWGNEPRQAAWTSVLMIVVAIPLVHLSCYILYSLRVFLYKKSNCSRNE